MSHCEHDWFLRWVSRARFEPYLRAAGHDLARARRLYEWNARLASAFLHDLAHLEVGLRNAFDRVLTDAVQPGEAHWTEHHTVLALFPARSGTHGGAPVRDALDALRRFRNRVAHHENVVRGAELHSRRLIGQVRRLSPDAAVDLQQRSEVASLLARRP